MGKTRLRKPAILDISDGDPPGTCYGDEYNADNFKRMKVIKCKGEVVTLIWDKSGGHLLTVQTVVACI